MSIPNCRTGTEYGRGGDPQRVDVCRRCPIGGSRGSAGGTFGIGCGVRTGIGHISTSTPCVFANVTEGVWNGTRCDERAGMHAGVWDLGQLMPFWPVHCQWWGQTHTQENAAATRDCPSSVAGQERSWWLLEAPPPKNETLPTPLLGMLGLFATPYAH